MTIAELITDFTKHVKQYGLNGDPKSDEMYKWEIITRYHDKLDADSDSFAQNIVEMNFKNLWYASNQRKAMQNFAKCEPEEYRILHQFLYDESQPLQERVTAFIDGCKSLWNTKIKQLFPDENANPCCDERLISCFLATKYPEKYTFYKNDVYLNLCELLGVEPKKAGRKLVHFYELLNEQVIPLVKENTELCNLVDSEVEQNNFIKSLPLTAQTVLWHFFSKTKGTNKKVWLFLGGKSSDDGEYYFDEMFADGVMVLCGWDKVGDLSDCDDLESIEAKRKEVPEYEFNDTHLDSMLHGIANEMQEGDIVLAKKKKSDIVGMGVVTSGYKFGDKYAYGKHYRMVEWTHKGLWDCSDILKEFGKTQFPAKALTDVSKSKDYPYVKKIIERLNDEKQEEIVYDKITVRMKEVKILRQKKQIVLQGAPGTGKTYRTATIAVAICDGEEKVPTDRASLMARYKQLVTEKCVAFTTFHQSMDYEEFVEGIKPETINGKVDYVVRNGIFREICNEATKTSEKNCVLIIDEINRANISKVLGELITLLEADKRLGELNEVKVRLPYSQEEFGVPSNLYIIGTMNTADRSVGYIDYAIRRRFAFVTIKADRTIVEKYNSITSNLALEYFDKVRSWMSDDNVIGDIDADDMMVGHSYFLADSTEELKTKMMYEVIPLLREYINDGILNADIKQEIKDWEEELA